MQYFEVAPLKIVRAGADVFTYASEELLEPGSIVKIPVGKASVLGVVIKPVDEPSFPTKPIERTVMRAPLPESLLQVAIWIGSYYRTPLATVLQTVLPRGLDKKRRATTVEKVSSQRDRTTIVLNPAQQDAVDTLLSAGQATTLLQGVTGSGKTEVYKEITRRLVAEGKSVIVLVPEISLTSQLVSEFAHDFPEAIVTHSHMTEAQRHVAWQTALEATKPQVVIGPRSALFMPVPKLGAILIDEAHEPSYKQEQAPRYSAIRAASMLGKFADALVVLGSATPSIADRYVAEAGNHPIIVLDTRARTGTTAANVHLIDMTKRDSFKRHRFLSDQLLTSIEQNLSSHHQTLVFHNRRGSAATTLCEHCGWTAQCPRCFVPLSLHADTFQLSCHICGHHEKVPTHCPVCQSADVIHKGIGTKLIESELRRIFPKARIARFDSDSKGDETVDKQYAALYKGEIDIAIGTQVVAKGLDLPHLRTVGVIQADNGLALPDFAASERAFQLLAQVVGRVGRTEHASDVYIQTYQPTHPAIQFGITQDYDGFYQYGLAQRRQGHFPPFTYLLRLTNVYKTETAAIRAARTLATELRHHLHADVRMFGPTPAFYERQHDTYRWQLILKSPKREHLIDALGHVPSTHWQTELDPVSLL
jgi:primosomal protein N' (replication factor Y) (superfamily II helicase)